MAIAKSGSRKVSGLFDIRNIIGSLLLIYGVVLVLVAVFTDSGSTSGSMSGKEGDTANLWAGVALVAVGLFFVVWARLRPVVVPEEVIEEIGGDGGGESG